MAEIKAFGAMRFTPKAGKLSELVCPPYDIISEEERKGYLARNPHNLIRLELPREGSDPYAQAGSTLQEWLDNGLLACDNAPTLYIYQEEFTVLGQRKTVKGLCCLVKLVPFSEGVVLPHEETLSKAKADRFNLMCATGCNFSSVYSLYFDEDRRIADPLDAFSSGNPAVTFTTDDGIIHRVWEITDPAAIADLAASFADKKLYIADGHHRYETGLNYRNHMAEQGGDPNHGSDYLMMTLVAMEEPGLVVMPIHRLVRGLESFDAEAILKSCEEYFDVTLTSGDVQPSLDTFAAQGKTAFALYLGGRKSAVLALRDASTMKAFLPDKSEGYQGLDVAVLHILVLERLMGIDKENMANQINLSYTRDAEEAMAAVDAGEANCAVIMNPTKVSEIAQVAGAGEKMPQKSTYFYPKLITGHLMNKIL